MYNMDIKRINISSHAHYNFGGNDMIDKINIEKDHIEFGNIKVHPPFTREKVDAVLGVPEIEEKDIEIDKNRYYHSVAYSWDELGIFSYADKLTDSYKSFCIYLDKIDTAVRKIDSFFSGQILIGNKSYTEVPFKPDKDGMCHEKKIGPFEISTVLADHLDELDDDFTEEWMTKEIEITYKAPRPKNSIYDLKKPDGPVLRFDSFEFKLLVIEELMYEKELLTPVFEIYDFAEKNPKREIDVDREGYEIIPEAKKWFRDYQIPAGLAPQISELIWDGGLNVFHQICPFWDGEDSCFDVKKLSTEEVQQFTGLKKVITGSGFSQKAIKMLIEQGIEVSE